MTGWIEARTPRRLASIATLLVALRASGTALAAGPAYAADGSVQQATYQSAADFRSAPTSAPNVIPNPRNSAESMPLDAPPHNAANGAAGGANGHRASPATPSSLPAILTMFGSLAVVLGLFLGMTWLLRRGLPRGTRLLSSEVVEVLGRTPLAPRQQMHVIRFGNRLLLVSVTSNGAETLAEITDPAEVDRLAGICQQSHAHSATNTFRQIFRQLSESRGGREIEPAKNGGRTARSAKTNRPTAAEDDDV